MTLDWPRAWQNTELRAVDANIPQNENYRNRAFSVRCPIVVCVHYCTQTNVGTQKSVDLAITASNFRECYFSNDDVMLLIFSTGVPDGV